MSFQDLTNLYHADCSPMELYYAARTSTVITAHLQIIWFDQYGHEKIQLTNNEAIRQFYRLNPQIKKIMDFD